MFEFLVSNLGSRRIDFRESQNRSEEVTLEKPEKGRKSIECVIKTR
jgi:hypothetical protein